MIESVIPDQKRSENGLRYPKTNYEKVALSPKIIKEGIEIGKHEDHKGRGYRTLTIAHPIEMDGVRGDVVIT